MFCVLLSGHHLWFSESNNAKQKLNNQKMKTKVFLFAIALISVVIFSSCESKSGKRVKEMKKVEKVSTPKADTDTLIFTPDKIGATELVKKFTSYPNFDGGTGMEISFFVGLQHKEKVYQVECDAIVFFGENLTQVKAEKDQRIADIILAHYLIKNTPISYVDVLVVKGEIIKFTRRAAFFPDGCFYPTIVIWEK